MGIGKDFAKAVVTQAASNANTISDPDRKLPIICVNKKLFTSDSKRLLDYEEAISILNKNNFHKNLKLSHIGNVVIIYIITFFFFFIPFIFYIIKGLIKINKDDVEYYSYASVPTYTQDRRYKSGVRYTGDITKKVKLTIPATPEDIKLYKKRGILYIVLGLIQFALQLLFVYLIR